MKGRLAAWGWSVKVGRGGTYVRTECMTGLIFAETRIMEKRLMGYIISSDLLGLDIGVGFFFEPIQTPIFSPCTVHIIYREQWNRQERNLVKVRMRVKKGGSQGLDLLCC